VGNIISITVRQSAPNPAIGPHTTDSAVVAAKILLGGAATVERVRRAGLEPVMLADPAAAQVVAMAFELADRGEPVDLLTVVRGLERTGDLPKIGGLATVLDIYESTYYAAGADADACSIVDAWRCCKLALELREVADEAVAATTNPHYRADAAQAALDRARRAVDV
jgi:replicative DNA helicase